MRKSKKNFFNMTERLLFSRAYTGFSIKGGRTLN